MTPFTVGSHESDSIESSRAARASFRALREAQNDTQLIQ